MSNETTVVHVIDDDAAMRDSLGFLLDVEGFATRLYPSAEAFLAVGAAAEPGCIITDVRMPGMSGIELVRRIRDLGLAHPVVVMTGHGDVPLAVEAMKAGARDFIEKPFSDETLLRALKVACESHDPDVASEAARREAETRLAVLSPRERDVLMGVVSGKANKVIAHELQISPRTVEVYRANLMSKTGARNMSDLMRLALAAGL
ncbi:MAG: response regulator FixJ [Pseudomonadota bacterium]